MPFFLLFVTGFGGFHLPYSQQKTFGYRNSAEMENSLLDQHGAEIGILLNHGRNVCGKSKAPTKVFFLWKALRPLPLSLLARGETTPMLR